MSTRSYRKSVDRVYLVEVKDERFGDGWYPMSVHLHKEAAEDTAAVFKYQYNNPMYARVTELRVVKHDGNRKR